MKLFRKAVVIIHGFTGNLYDNEYLMNYLEVIPNILIRFGKRMISKSLVMISINKELDIVYSN